MRRIFFDETLHRLARGRQHVDHAAVVGGKTWRDLTPQRAVDQAYQRLGALIEIDIRKLLVEDRDVESLRHLLREVAVRVELGGDQHLRAGDLPRALQKVALAVVVAVRDHRAVQPEDRRIERQGRLQLLQDLVAQHLVGVAVDRPAGCRRGGRALDHHPARGRRMATGRDDRARDDRWLLGMLARPRQEALPKAFQVDRQRRVGVDLGREGGGEDAGHEGPPFDCGRSPAAVLP